MLFMQPDGVFNTTLYQDVTYTTCGCKVRNQCTLNHALAVFIAAPPTLSYVCACVVYTRGLKLWSPENYTTVHVLGVIQHLSLVRLPFRQWMQRQPVGAMQSASANMERVTPPSSKKGRRSYVLQRDFRVLEREQRVTRILNSGAFRSELEGIMKSQIDGSRRPPKLSKAIQRLQENVVEATASRHGQGTASLQVTVPAQPVLPIDDLRGVNASKYTLAERHLRCKLAAVYRLVDMFGWSQLIHNHITVSVHP